MKQKRVYVCGSCGCQAPRWLGKCPDCGAWNSMAEEVTTHRSQPEGAGFPRGGEPVPVGAVGGVVETRTTTGIGEFDRVLGGGVVAGSIVLIGGDPGIGKSTLLLQVADRLARGERPVLYVSGEESPRQIGMRAGRMGVDAPNLLLLAETSLETILARTGSLSPDLLVVDSIQTIHTSSVESAPGSVSQVRECAGRLMLHAKKSGVPVFLVGHVTKDGTLAGPRVLEHLVDTVLSFEGDRSHSFRILRAVKNRFGSTNEIGVFDMRGEGLVEVANPSELFLTERPTDAAGSVVVSSLEGTRPLLVELQALVCGSQYGVPRRTTIGVDQNRVALLVAVLEKRGGLHLAGFDIFINVAGGVRLGETATDLGIVAALASSHLDRPIPPDTLVIGEVGLAGEVRGVASPEIRVGEGAKLGFRRCILPRSSARKVAVEGMEIVGVSSVQELLEALW